MLQKRNNVAKYRLIPTMSHPLNKVFVLCRTVISIIRTITLDHKTSSVWYKLVICQLRMTITLGNHEQCPPIFHLNSIHSFPNINLFLFFTYRLFLIPFGTTSMSATKKNQIFLISLHKIFLSRDGFLHNSSFPGKSAFTNTQTYCETMFEIETLTKFANILSKQCTFNCKKKFISDPLINKY